MAKKKTKTARLIGLTKQLIIAEEVDIAYWEQRLDNRQRRDEDELVEVLTSAIQRLTKKDDVHGFELIILADPTVDVEPYETPEGFSATASYYLEQIAAIASPLPGIVFAPEATTLAIIVGGDECEYYLPLSPAQVVELFVTEENFELEDVGPLEILLDWLHDLGRAKKKGKKAHA